MQNSVIFIIIGALAGVFAGMGMGGGTFLLPLLVIVCSFSQLQAQSVNLLAFIPMAIFALIIHIKNGLVNYKVGLIAALLSCAGTVAGVFLLKIVDAFYLRLLYALFLLCIGVWLFIDAIIARKKHKKC